MVRTVNPPGNDILGRVAGSVLQYYSGNVHEVFVVYLQRAERFRNQVKPPANFLHSRTGDCHESSLVSFADLGLELVTGNTVALIRGRYIDKLPTIQ